MLKASWKWINFEELISMPQLWKSILSLHSEKKYVNLSSNYESQPITSSTLHRPTFISNKTKPDFEVKVR